jgi:hypothetical protein
MALQGVAHARSGTRFRVVSRPIVVVLVTLARQPSDPDPPGRVFHRRSGHASLGALENTLQPISNFVKGFLE